MSLSTVQVEAAFDRVTRSLRAANHGSDALWGAISTLREALNERETLALRLANALKILEAMREQPRGREIEQ